MGLSFTDVTTLVTKGYKVSEINDVKQIIENNPDDGKNIVELAKKLGYADFKSAMSLFDKTDNGAADQNNSNDESDKGEGESGENQNDTSSDDQGAGNDNVDYKKLYETEKALRQKLQQDNQNEDASDNEDKQSDIDIALSFASDVLN